MSKTIETVDGAKALTPPKKVDPLDPCVEGLGEAACTGLACLVLGVIFCFYLMGVVNTDDDSTDDDNIELAPVWVGLAFFVLCTIVAPVVICVRACVFNSRDGRGDFLEAGKRKRVKVFVQSMEGDRVALHDLPSGLTVRALYEALKVARVDVVKKGGIMFFSQSEIQSKFLSFKKGAQLLEVKDRSTIICFSEAPDKAPLLGTSSV